MKLVDLSKISLVIGIMILSSFGVGFFVINYSYAAQIESISIDGYFNISEKRFESGKSLYQYYLFVNEDDHITTYFLKFKNPPDNLLMLSGYSVNINGKLISDSVNKNDVFYDSKTIEVSTIDGISDSLGLAQKSSLHRDVPSSLKTVVILGKYFGDTTEPHSSTYFESRFFTDMDSLAAYWDDTSYGEIAMSAGTVDGTGVVNWQELPSTSTEYGIGDGVNEPTRRQDMIDLADSSIDFDGDDNQIQNIGPQIGGPADNGDDVDQVIMIYNDVFDDGNYAFAFFDPVPIVTDEGTLYVYLTHSPDTGDGFPVGIDFENGVGTIAHEMGHNFEWRHTPPPSGVDTYADPWSLMSGGDADGPPGVIAFNKDQAGWIPDVDKIKIPEGTEDTFTLDILSDLSPDSNYLMATIPFGSDGEYYTLEARKDSTFDQTPLDQFGLMIYYYNPAGHVGSPEDDAPVNVVDTTGIEDWDNTDLDLGDSYVANDITVEYLSETENTITVRVDNNGGTDSFTLDASGTAKLKKAVTKGTPTFGKGTYDITIQITADIDSVNSKGIPKLSNVSGTFAIDGNDSYDAEFTKLKLTVDKKLKLIKWTAKEGKGEFKFASNLDFNEKTDQAGKKSTISKITVGKATFTPKVTTSSIDFT